MRHLIGIILAIVMTAALLCGATWGYVRFLAQSSRLPAGVSLLSDHHALFALGALAGTGLLAGILIAAPRISPLAAGLPGLLLLGISVVYLVSVRRADELIPLRSQVFGAGFETLLARGLLGAAGLAMIVPLFVPSRWRSRRSAELAGELGPAGTEDSELAGLVPGFGGMPGPGAASGSAGPTATIAAGEPGARPATAHSGPLPQRNQPPGIGYR